MSPKAFFIIVLISVLITACQNAAAPVAISNRPVAINDTRQPSAPSKPVETMSWTQLDGTEQTLGELSNKVVVLDLWATYCDPCRREIPHLNSLQAKYGADNIQIVGLNVGGNDDRPKIPAFVKELKVTYPIAFPEDALLSYISEDDDRIPQTAIFDRHGQLVLKVVGFDPDVQKQLDSAIDSAIRQ
jgi:thiol-disulfide isomerase/thioredoxin